VQSIKDIYVEQVRNGVEITDLTMLNTDNGAMGQCMDMFLHHKVQENALIKLTAIEKRRSVIKQEWQRRQEALGFLLASWPSPMGTR
jgi:hypothetical protein